MRCICLAPFVLLSVGAFRVKQAVSVLESINAVGGGSDVCEPEKGFFFTSKRPSDSKLVERLADKQSSLLKLARWLDDTHCIFGMKHGKICFAKWIELGQRLRKIRSCAKVPQDMNSLLSKAVWGEGSLNLKKFLQEVNTHVGMALTKNKLVQKYLLEPSSCELNLGKIRESIETHVKDENRSAVVDKIVDDVMGLDCDVNRVPPLAVFRSSLKRTIKQTVKEVRDGDMNAPIDRMDRDWEAMEDSDKIERVGHELADEDSDDAQEAVKKVESSSGEKSGSWMNKAAGAFLEVASDVARADPVKLLIWLLLFLLIGPIALIIWIVILVCGRHDLAGI
jgi:hypothetical protein